MGNVREATFVGNYVREVWDIGLRLVMDGAGDTHACPFAGDGKTPCTGFILHEESKEQEVAQALAGGLLVVALFGIDQPRSAAAYQIRAARVGAADVSLVPAGRDICAAWLPF